MSTVSDPSGPQKVNPDVSQDAPERREFSLFGRTRSIPTRLNIWLAWPLLFAGVATILYWRVPNVFRHASFFAEDGNIFFKQEYEQGLLSSLCNHYAGYLDFAPRIMAACCAFFAVEHAPFAFAIVSLIVATAVFTFFIAPGFRAVIDSDSLRAVIVLIFALMPNSDSLIKVAYINWFMVIFLALITLMTLPKKPVQLWLLLAPMFVAAWSTPVAFILLPVIALRAWKAEDKSERFWWIATAISILAYPFTEVRPPSLISTMVHDFGWIWALIHALAYRVFDYFFLGEMLCYPWKWEGWKLVTCLGIIFAGMSAVGTALAVTNTRQSGHSRRVPLLLFYLIMVAPDMFVLRTDGWHFFLRWSEDAWEGNGRYFYCSTIMLCILGGVIYERVLLKWTGATAQRRGLTVLAVLFWLNLHQLTFKIWGWHGVSEWASYAREIRAAENRVTQHGGTNVVHIGSSIGGFDFDLHVDQASAKRDPGGPSKMP